MGWWEKCGQKVSRFLVFFTVFSLSAQAGGKAPSHVEGASSLIAAFASGCKSHGTWTEAALSQTHSLESVIRALKEKENCSGLNNALTHAQSLTQQIQMLAGDPLQSALKEAQEMKRQLLIDYNSTQDPNLQSVLAQSLAQAEVAVAQAKGSLKAGTNSNLVRGLTQATSYLNNLLTDPTLSECANRFPTLGVQIGAQAMAIAGSFVNPSIGVAMASVGQVVSSLVAFFRNRTFDNEMWKLQASALTIALSCGLEAMTSTFCAAQDQFVLAKLEADSFASQWKPTPFWQGIQLWSNKIPGLMSWLSKIATGAIPSDPAGADRINKVFDRLNQLSAVERSVQGVIGPTKRLLGSPGADREALTRRGLNQIEDAMGFASNPFGPTSPSPVRDFFPTRTHVLYRLIGVPLDCSPGGAFGGGNCKDELTIPLPPQGYSAIIARAAGIFADVRNVLLGDLHLVIDLDPQGLLAEATQVGIIGKESPLEVMKDMLVFLDQSEAYLIGLHKPEVYQQVLTLIGDTRGILRSTIEAIVTSNGTPDGTKHLIEQLFDHLGLIQGTNFISQRLYRHIKWDLYARILQKEVPNNVEDILKGSGSDAASELEVSTRISLDVLSQDIANAKMVTQENLRNFVEFFSGGFTSTLARLKASSLQDKEPKSGPLGRPNHIVLSRICLLLASAVSAWPPGIDPKLCEGGILDSIYPGFKETLKFENLKKSLDAGEPLETRICSYRNFIRRSTLFGTTRPDAPKKFLRKIRLLTDPEESQLEAEFLLAD